MRKYFYITFLSLFSAAISAETYLCIGEKGAGISNTGQKIQEAEIYDMSKVKLILSNSTGKWILKNHGGGPTSLDACVNENLCLASNGMFGGSFVKNKLNVFTYHLFETDMNDKNTVADYLVKGLCSEI